MLPRPLLESRIVDGSVAPIWLEARHDAWLRSVIEAFEAVSGLSVAEVDQRGQDLASLARASGVSATTAFGVWHVLRRCGRTEIVAGTSPKQLREEMFANAAACGRHEALRLATERYRVSAREIRDWLFADLPHARRFRASQMPPLSQLRDDYNMALAQGLLGRCTSVAIQADENLRAVVRAAKLQGLLVSIEAEGAILRASGPLALFRHTTKYARALGMFLPSLVSFARWSLRGDILVGDRVASLHLDPSAPLPRRWALPQRTDSQLEARVVRSLRSSSSGWSIRREGIVLRCGRELFFPDFVLERGDERVVVEVVGFWTPEYLERKLGQLETVTDWPLVVCVDETLACDPTRLPAADIVRFRRTLDPQKLLAAAERATERFRARSSAAGSRA